MGSQLPARGGPCEAVRIRRDHAPQKTRLSANRSVNMNALAADACLPKPPPSHRLQRTEWFTPPESAFGPRITFRIDLIECSNTPENRAVLSGIPDRQRSSVRRESRAKEKAAGRGEIEEVLGGRHVP